MSRKKVLGKKKNSHCFYKGSIFFSLSLFPMKITCWTLLSYYLYIDFDCLLVIALPQCSDIWFVLSRASPVVLAFAIDCFYREQNNMWTYERGFYLVLNVHFSFLPVLAVVLSSVGRRIPKRSVTGKDSPGSCRQIFVGMALSWFQI